MRPALSRIFTSHELIRHCFLRQQAEKLPPTLRRHEKHPCGFLLNPHFSRVPTRAYPTRKSRLAYKISPILRGSLILFAVNMGSDGRLQAVSTECGLIGGECGSETVLVGAECEPKMPLVCGFWCPCLRAATHNSSCTKWPWWPPLPARGGTPVNSQNMQKMPLPPARMGADVPLTYWGLTTMGADSLPSQASATRFFRPSTNNHVTTRKVTPLLPCWFLQSIQQYLNIFC